MRCFGDKTRTYHCKVVLLDEQELIQEVQDTTTGQDLLDVVLQHLNLLETAYFGLRFLDLDNQTHWLDPVKRLVKQLKGTSPHTLYFSVKFYAADPTKLVEEITRYQFFLQVKQDILQGRLPVSLDLAAELGAYAVQSELGDYDPRRHSPGYVSEFRFVAGQGGVLETRVGELHKKLVGQVPAKSELNYLEKIKWLDMYGVDLHPVLGEDNIEYFLGLTPSGAIVLRNKTKVGNYFWPRISKVYFRGRFFMLRVRDKNNTENTYGFETPSRAACKHLWQCCVEHHAFFRLTQTAGNTVLPVFSLGSKFRYSGRTEKEVMQEARLSVRQQPEVTRTPSRRYQRRVVEGVADTPRAEDTDPHKEGSAAPLPGVPLATSNVYRTTSMTLNARGASSPRSIRSAPHQASSSVPPIGRTRTEDSINKLVQRSETRSESRGRANNNSNNSSTSRPASPRSVRSAAPAVGGSSSSTTEPRMSRRTSSVDSQSSIDSRGHRRHRRRSRCRSSDGGESEASSKCSSRRRHHRKHRHHHRHNSDDSSEHHKHKHRRHRHKSSDSAKQLVESDQQWARVQAGQRQVHGQTATVRDLSHVGQTATVRDISTKSGYAPSVDTEIDSQHHTNKKKHRKHRSRSRSPNEAKNSRYPSELRRHIDYGLQDTNGLTEAQLKDIPYTRVETANNIKTTKYGTTGSSGKKHKSPRRSKSNSSDRKLAPPDGESPPPLYNHDSSKRHHSTSRRKSKSSSDERRVEGESQGDVAEEMRQAAQQPYLRAAPSGESSTPPPPPMSVLPNPRYASPVQYGPTNTPHNFPGYVPNGVIRDGLGRLDNPNNTSTFGPHKPTMIHGPSIKSLVTGGGAPGAPRPAYRGDGGRPAFRGEDISTSSNNSCSSSDNNSSSSSLSPHKRLSVEDDRHIISNGLGRQNGDQNGYIQNGYGPNHLKYNTGPPVTYLKQSSLERGTRGSSISKPQPSPQSSVTSGISVGGSSTSTTIMEEDEPTPGLPPRGSATQHEGVTVANGYYNGQMKHPAMVNGHLEGQIKLPAVNGHLEDQIKPSPPNGYHNGSPDGQVKPPATTNGFHDGSSESKTPIKPPIPGNKPIPPSRPHSMYSSDAPNLNLYPNGFITTQISDQDGYRATRIPMEGQRILGNGDYLPNKMNDQIVSAPAVNGFSNNRNNSNVADSDHSLKMLNGNGGLPFNNSNHIVNGKIPALNNRNTNPAQNNNNRYSYPNGVNSSTEGVRIKNLINTTNGSSVNNMVARFSGPAQVTSPNGNSTCQADFEQMSSKYGNSEEQGSNRNGREEASTEL